jgi:EamA domain-containing membrane protein RarD
MSVCVLVLVSTNTYLFVAKNSELITLNSLLFECLYLCPEVCFWLLESAQKRPILLRRARPRTFYFLGMFKNGAKEQLKPLLV